MPRGRKKAVKKPAPTSEAANLKNCQDDYLQFHQRMDQEVERKVAAMRAIRDVEIEHLLTGLRLLRTYVTEEQMGSPALQFFNSVLPNVSVVRDTEDGPFEMHWKENDTDLSRIHVDGRDICASLLRRMSMAYPDCSTSIPHFGGFELSSRSVKTSFLDVESLQIRDFVLDENDNQMLGLQDTLRTPGLSTQRLSIGMTPKTLRLPKPGEMLLSVHGSPLGVYKEENMEAIHESDETT